MDCYPKHEPSDNHGWRVALTDFYGMVCVENDIAIHMDVAVADRVSAAAVTRGKVLLSRLRCSTRC